MNKNFTLSEQLYKNNLNLHSLSERSGVAYSTVYNLFTGHKKITNISAESLYKISRFLGMTMDELYLSFRADNTQEEKIFPDFLLMWADEVSASVSVGDTAIFVDRYNLHPVKQIFYKDTLNRYEFGEILRRRCWDEHRDDMDLLLKMLGLQEYNPYEICKKTHGKMVQDKIWFKFEGETLSYRDLKERKYL